MEVSVFIFCNVTYFKVKQTMLVGFNHEGDWYQIPLLWLGHSKVGLAVERDGTLLDQED